MLTAQLTLAMAHKVLIGRIAYCPTATICSVDNNKCVSGCPGAAKSELKEK